MAYYTVNSGSDTDLTAKGKRLRNWHFRNVTAAAVINLRNGSAAGDIIVPINLAVDTSASQAYPLESQPVFPLGVFVDWVSGTITGSLDIE